MNPEQAIAALTGYFSKTKLNAMQLALYVQKLGELRPEEIARACESAIEKHRYKTIPSVAELLAWGQGREPGRAQSAEARGRAGTDEDAMKFGQRQRDAERRGDHAEVDFLARLTRAWHSARYRRKTGKKHPQDTDYDLDGELSYLGLDQNGDALNGRPLHELAVPNYPKLEDLDRERQEAPVFESRREMFDHHFRIGRDKAEARGVSPWAPAPERTSTAVAIRGDPVAVAEIVEEEALSETF